MTSELDKAFALLSRYREGKISTGSRVTPQQLRLIRLLASDLAKRRLPKNIDDNLFAEVLVEVYEKDAVWNRRFMQVVAQATSLRRDGKLTAALAHLDVFIKDCSSDWYRMHAREVKKSFGR
jgi:hypothetical protein